MTAAGGRGIITGVTKGVIYLVGPRSGAVENVPAFEDAARRLRDAGYTVFSPPEDDELAGRVVVDRDAQGTVRQVARTACRPPANLFGVTAVARLDGSLQSFTARRLLDLARRVGIPADTVDSLVVRAGVQE